VSKPGLPQMSVILVTPDRYDTIRQTVNHLKAQTVRHRLEIVIVAPSLEGLHVDKAELADFFQFCIVEVGEITSIGAGNAAGVRAASASIVALGEDHSFPDPPWAEALIKAHRNPWAAVGPEVRNGNPNNMISWADFLIGYGPWLEPARALVIQHLPGHNSSYKRSILMEYGPELDTLFEAESILHGELRAKNHQLYLEPHAKIAHLNFEQLSSWIPALFFSGRVFAAVRSRHWSILRRFIYAGGAPFIPVVRFLRILPQLGRMKESRRSPHRLVSLLSVSFAGLIVSAAGETVGYALGGGNANRKLSFFEFHRTSRLRHKSKRKLWRATASRGCAEED
jgi:hypothetical protein